MRARHHTAGIQSDLDLGCILVVFRQSQLFKVMASGQVTTVTAVTAVSAVTAITIVTAVTAVTTVTAVTAVTAVTPPVLMTCTTVAVDDSWSSAEV